MKPGPSHLLVQDKSLIKFESVEQVMDHGLIIMMRPLIGPHGTGEEEEEDVTPGGGQDTGHHRHQEVDDKPVEWKHGTGVSTIVAPEPKLFA